MTFLIFFIIIAALILSHEFGHFLAAKLTNTKVEEFGFGFPPRIFWWKKNKMFYFFSDSKRSEEIADAPKARGDRKIKGETVYSFNLFPIGGFVKILGEDGVPQDKAVSESSRNFTFKPTSVKAAIISAGVLFNLILAWILISISLNMGAFQQIDDNFVLEDVQPQVIIVEVQKGSPAEAAGLTIGDKLAKLVSDGQTLEPTRMAEVQNFINLNRGNKIKITYERGKDAFTSSVKLRDIKAEEGALGIAMARVAVIKEPWYAAIFKGFKQTMFLTAAIASAIFDFIIGIFKGIGFEQVAGPIGIFNIVGQASRIGISHLIQLSAVLSINLAIINFFPFPALDGGRLIVVLIEKIKGSPINYKVINLIHGIGFALLIILMLLVTYQDILRVI